MTAIGRLTMMMMMLLLLFGESHPIPSHLLISSMITLDGKIEG